jgi:hypothetical protein
VAAVGSAATTTDTSSSITTGATSNATDLVIGYIQNGSGAAITPGAGFTEINETVSGIETEGKSVTTTGAQTCTTSWTGGTNWQGLCVALKASGGGGGSPTLLRRKPIIQ